jgi:hypothetical protein
MWNIFDAYRLTNRRTRKRVSRRAFGFEHLEGRDLMAVTFHGGQLLQHVETQAVFLGSDWSSTALQPQTAAIDQYLSYLVQSPYMDMLNQAGYGVGQGTSTTGSQLNLGINKTTGITDSQIRADLQAAVSSGQLSTPDANRLYVVYVEPGVAIKLGTDSSTNSFLGYHGAFAGTNAAGAPVDFRYAVMAYPGTPNPSSTSQGFSTSFQQLTSVTSHELVEAVTDPDVNYKAIGWYDDQRNGEIGDLTSRTTVLNGYVVQDVVNKSDQVIAPTTSGTTTPPPTPTPAPTPTPTLAAPQSVAITALSATDAQLSWSGVAAATGYRIYQMSGTQATLLGTVAAATTSVKITGLTPGATQSFRVEAFQGTAVADSAVVSVTMPAQQSLAAPQVTAVAISSSAVQLSWSAVSGAQGFNIYWWNGFQAVLIGSVGASSTSVTVTGLTGGTLNRFVVEAFNGSVVADSAWAVVALPTPTRPRGGGWRWY